MARWCVEMAERLRHSQPEPESIISQKDSLASTHQTTFNGVFDLLLQDASSFYQ